MRCIVLILGIAALLMGQAPGLAWVELADTVYKIENGQDTTKIYIQSRSGNIRRFDLYLGLGANRYLAAYDTVFLDASGRVARIRGYDRPNGNSPFSIAGEAQFRYLGTPAIKVELTNGVSSTVLGDEWFYGLTIFEGSQAWAFWLGIEPVDVYPIGYRTSQYGDSILVRSFTGDQAIGFARRARSGACDTVSVYFGPANGPLSPAFGGKMCHTNGRIDSVITLLDKSYWSYGPNNRPVQRLDISGSDTTRYEYIYDAGGRLIESRVSSGSSTGSSLRVYLLRYRGAPASLAVEVERGCLNWDAASRRGWFSCKGAGDVTVVQAYDIQGRLVWEGRVEGSGVFELPASLPAGLYHLRTGMQGMKVYLLP